LSTDNEEESSKLDKFNYQDYFILETDLIYKGKLPKAELKQSGVDLVSQYYSYKYQMENLIKTWNVDELIQVINSEDFSKIRNIEDDIRIPFLITGTHSTPVAYVKEGGKEYLLIFDSLGDSSMAQNAAEFFPEINVYTSISKIRQRDDYSCHAEAQIFLRELIGKDEKGNFLIPNILSTLSENIIKDKTSNDHPPNFHTIKLFDRLLITTQTPLFMAAHEQEYKSNDLIHRHKGQPENIEAFLKRYPPEEVVYTGKKPTVSSYLREKGLKLGHIIEIQFYLNQLESRLGSKFTKNLKDDFIDSAKKKLKQYGKISLFTEQQKKNTSLSLYNLSQKFLEDNFKLSEAKPEASASQNYKEKLQEMKSVESPDGGKTGYESK
jgi:hypothetical protein